MHDTITQLHARRSELAARAESIARAARSERRDLTATEETEFRGLVAEADQVADRIAALDAQEQRASNITNSFDRLGIAGGVGNRERDNLTDEFRDMGLNGNPRPILVGAGAREMRAFQPAVEARDLITSSPAGMRPTHVANEIWQYAINQSGVLAAGATVLVTPDGADINLPRNTAISSSLLTAESVALTESNPTLSAVTLGSYKLGTYCQISSELLQDGGPDLNGFILKQLGQSVGVLAGQYFATGSGSGEPTGIKTAATLGVTAPTGVTTTLGQQADVDEGTDLAENLYASVHEGYLGGSTAFVAKQSTISAFRRLKTTAGELVGPTWMANSPAPWIPDANLDALGVTKKVAFFGDWSNFVIRQAGPIRVERSDEFAFDRDVSTYRVVIRVDSNLVLTDSVKYLLTAAS